MTTYGCSQLSSNVELALGGLKTGKKATAKFFGKHSITVEIGGRQSPNVHSKVRTHVRNLGYQLLSVPTMDKLELELSFTYERFRVKTDTKIIASGTLGSSSYSLDLVKLSKWHAKAMGASLQCWHEHLAHVDNLA